MRKTKSIKNKLPDSKFWILDSRKAGQTLVETLVAVSVLVTGFLGIVSLLSQSLGLNRVAADNYTASYLAAEGVEVVKNILDSNLYKNQNWLQGVGSGKFRYEAAYNDHTLKPFSAGDKLWLDSDTHLFSYAQVGEETGFTREIDIDSTRTDEVQVNSIVRWTTRGGGELTVDDEDHFFNWRNPSK